MIRIEEFIVNDRSPFRDWLERLDPQARVMIAVAIERLADGNTSNVKSIGEGAAELKIAALVIGCISAGMAIC